MSKQLHPVGRHTLRLVDVKNGKFGILVAQCIFEGTGENKYCQTISRLISKHGKWGKTSWHFLNQLEGFKTDNEIVPEIRKFIGQEFCCEIPRQGNGFQMNISQFLEKVPDTNNAIQLIEEKVVA